MMNKQPGYILVLTLLMLSLGTVMVTRLFVQARTYTAFSMVDTKREQARHLAQSGIALAIAQLSLHDTAFKDANEKKTPEKDEKKIAELKERQLLKTLLRVQNRWQKFVLTYEHDGIDATLSFCITCEEGKLNLNKLWDFKQHRFSSALLRAQDPAKLFGLLGEAAAPFTQNKNMFDAVVETLKKRKQPLLDVTELLTNTSLWDFKDHVFYDPPVDQLKEETASSFGNEPAKQKEKIALTDLFTIWTDDAVLYPLLLSSSMRILFRLPDLPPITKELGKEIDALVEKIPLDGINWMQQWNTYAKPVFNKEFSAIRQEMIPFLGAKFEPRIFSVLCYAEVGIVKQKLLAILERSRVEKGEAFKVKRIYWI